MAVARPPNPVLVVSTDADDPGVVVELKKRLVLYLDEPPEVDTVAALYRMYVDALGASITHYRSTAFGSILEPWTGAARDRFERLELPRLYEKTDWGYMFGSTAEVDGRLFLFHGARPASEPSHASLLRYDFEWDFDADQLLGWTADVLERVQVVCGTAGYVLADGAAAPSFDELFPVFAAAMRYWGAQAQDLDVSVDGGREGIACVDWLTVLGSALQMRSERAVHAACKAASACFDVRGQTIVQVEEQPRLVDRNRREPLGAYADVAACLAPFQRTEHPSFDDDPWDESSTRAYLHRFTEAWR